MMLIACKSSSSRDEVSIIKALGEVDTIVDIAAVTEDNDPNGRLNKVGGYSAQIYFSSNLVDQESVSGTTVIEKGTDCGGSIEVYKTKKEARERNEELASYDGSVLASGSHVVDGTCVIRISNELTASQQEELEANIIVVLKDHK